MISLIPSLTLYSEKDFYDTFLDDLQHAKKEVIIESPFIALKRSTDLLMALNELTDRRVRVILNTRCPAEHNEDYELQALQIIHELQEMGVTVLYTVKLHRKLTVIDRKIMWEGSLNIMSYSDSCEVMSRHFGKRNAKKFLRFLGIYN